MNEDVNELYWMMRDHLKMCRNLDRVLVDTRVI